MKIITRIKDALRGEQNLDKFIKRGLRVGKNFHRMGGVVIDPSHCWHITIGDDVTLAPRVHILAHDASTKVHLGYTKVANVRIGNRVFIGASSIIMPGVTVGDDVIIGAGSIVTKDIPSGSVAVGAPACVICSLKDYLEKEKAAMNDDNCFGEEYTVRGGISAEKKQKMVTVVNQFNKCFVR